MEIPLRLKRTVKDRSARSGLNSISIGLHQECLHGNKQRQSFLLSGFGRAYPAIGGEVLYLRRSIARE
ncbi:MAG: hypothetical protein ACFCU8_17330 [Thermosynechococcaceae cyanobacterium]